MSKIFLFLSLLSIAQLLPAQNRPLKLALSVGLPQPFFANPHQRIHLSINPSWRLTKYTYLEGAVAYSSMKYFQNHSSFFGHHKGLTTQADILAGFRWYLVGESYLIRPYLTLLGGYGNFYDEEERDTKVWVEHSHQFQIATSVNLEINNSFILTIGVQSVQLLGVARIGFQF